MGASGRAMTMLHAWHGTIGLGMSFIFISAISASSRSGDEGLRQCAAITNDGARLACYDREVHKLIAPAFAGRLSNTTDRFSIDRPTLLRYQSEGVIFVLYLKAADGSVVQNLHIGGAGEATYLIEQPGTYYLDVNGSEGWRIWLEPQPPSTPNPQDHD